MVKTLSLQVYEHVYETVDISSSPEVRANATAKVTGLSLSKVGLQKLELKRAGRRRVKCLLWKPEDLSADPQLPANAGLGSVYNPSAGGGER